MNDPVRLVRTLDEVLADCRANAASPEAIAEYDRSIAEAREFELSESRRRRRNALVEAGVPLSDAMLDAIVDGKLRQTEALRVAHAWLQGPRSVLAMIGDHGTGKTTAAGHACVARLPKGSVAYVKEPTLARWSMFARYDREWKLAVEAATLVLDEAGTAEERDLPSARAGTLRMIDDRLGRGRKTIWIGNLTKADLARRYDARLLDRLREHGFVAEILGESIRGGTS